MWKVVKRLLDKLPTTALIISTTIPIRYSAGLERAIAKGWLELHESGTFVKFTEAGAALFSAPSLIVLLLFVEIAHTRNVRHAAPGGRDRTKVSAPHGTRLDGAA
jgi:hypothetical protein